MARWPSKDTADTIGFSTTRTWTVAPRRSMRTSEKMPVANSALIDWSTFAGS